MYALPNYFGRNQKYKKLLERTVQIVSWSVWDTVSKDAWYDFEILVVGW